MEYGCVLKGKPETGESVNSDRGWTPGSKTKACGLCEVVMTEIGEGRPGGFIDVYFGRSGTAGFVLS